MNTCITVIARNKHGVQVTDNSFPTMNGAEAWAKTAFGSSIAVWTVAFELHSAKSGVWSRDRVLKTWDRSDYLKAIGR